MQSELLKNHWFGKAVGFTLAFVIAPDNHAILSLYVILGITLGHAFDLWASHQANQTQPPPASLADRDHPQRSPFLKFLFGAMGQVARQSGTIQPQQIEIAEQTIKTLDLARVDAIGWFNSGKQGKTTFAKLAKACQPVPSDWQALLLRALVDVTAVQPSDAAMQTAVKLGGLVGIAPSKVAEQFGSTLKGHGGYDTLKNQKGAHKQSHDGQSKAGAAGGSSSQIDPALHDAYTELGVSPSAPMREVKRAYRRLASQYHPDKLGPDSSAQARSDAQDKMVRIGHAMDTIKTAKRKG